MHSGLVVEQDLVHDRKENGQQYNMCAPYCSNVRIIEKVKQEGQNMPHLANRNHRISLTQDRASEGLDTLNT